MTDNGIGDYFISDLEDEVLEDEDEGVSVPVVVPSATPRAEPQGQAERVVSTGVGQQPAAQGQPAVQPSPPRVEPATTPPAPAAPSPSAPAAPARPQPPAAATLQATAKPPSREDRLAAALDGLLSTAPDIQAAALVSVDGFTMASALPDGMQEDRVGAMSAAILGLGERAAAELGRGHLSQVFIEGAGGYVMLMAAGERAVLTALATPEAKLGLIIYDIRETARAIAEILA